MNIQKQLTENGSLTDKNTLLKEAQNLIFAFGGKNKVATPVKDCTPNTKITLPQLIELIKSDAPSNALKVREIVKNGFKNNVHKDAIKAEAKPFKKSLPFVLFSGFCPIHHNNKTIFYNGAIQVDFDFYFVGGDFKAIELKERLKNNPNVIIAAISPSGFGVKCLIATDNFDIELHKKVSDAIGFELCEKYNIDYKYYDSLGASQPCFIPYDKNVYFNHNYTVYNAFKALYVFEQHEKQELQKDLLKATKTAQNVPYSIANDINDQNGSFEVPSIKVLEYLTTEIVKSNFDITDGYNEWFAVAAAYASCGEAARTLFHSVAALNSGYDYKNNDKKFDNALKEGKSNVGYIVNRCKEVGIYTNDFCKDYIRTFAPKNNYSFGSVATAKNTFLGYEVERFELSKTQYISDVYSDDLTEQILLFLAKTGLGKSTLIQSYNHSIIASFLSTTVQNYANDGFNVYSGTAQNYDISDVFGNDRNATTFKSLTAVYNAKKGQYNDVKEFYKNTVLVIDEFQQLLTDSFAKSTLQKTIEIIKNHIENGGKVRILTANELIFYFDFLDGLKIKHFLKDEILKPLYVYSFDSSKKIETFANFVNVSHQRERKTLALTNRTELHNDNKELQKLTSDKALNLDRNSKNTFDFSQGLERSIFATTALNTGVNIYEKKTDSVIFEYNDFTQLSQFWGRLRYKQNENFYTQSNSYTLFNNFDFNDKKLNYNECLELSQRNLKNLIKNAKSEIEFCINSEITKNKASHGSNVIWNNELNIGEVDYLTINQKNHSYFNTLLHCNQSAFVEMIKKQGYDVTFLEYEYEIESEVLTDDKNEFKGFLTALKLTALSNIQKQCFVNVNGSDYAIEYKNKPFDYWFKKASFKDSTIKKLYHSYKELTKILASDKLSFEVLTDSVNYSDVIFDKFIKKSSRSTTESLKLVDSKRIVQRFAFAAAFYKIDSVKFQNFVGSLTATNLTTNDILNVLTAANDKYEIKFFDKTQENDKAGLKASLGIVSDLKKWFGNDLTSIVRKTLLSIETNDSNGINKTLIRVLSNHFKTDNFTSGSGSERSKSYQFEILGKKTDFK